MAETDVHARYMMDVRLTLEIHFRAQQDVYVSGNLLLYYEEGNPRRSVSPDVLVTRGIPKGLRRTYLLWVEGKAPDFVLEVTSSSTRRKDIGAKRELYESLGVREYVLYDPLGDYLDPQLQGYALRDGRYQPLPLVVASGQPALRSAVLGLDLRLDEGRLRLYDPAAAEWLLFPDEEAAARRAAEAEVARLRAALAGRNGAAADQ